MSITHPKNLLHEFETIGYDTTKLKPYSDFLDECASKDYSNHTTQLHHIFPKSMNNDVYLEETIRLSLLDHFNAHRILAECFEVGSLERRMNFSACKFIKVHIKRYMTNTNHAIPDDLAEFWNLADEIMKDFQRGENNTFYGKTHTEETRKIIKEKRKLQVFTEEQKKFHGDRLKKLPNTQKGAANPNFGKTFDEIYGIEKSLEIKQKLTDARKLRFPDQTPPEVTVLGDGSAHRNCPTCNNNLVYQTAKLATIAHKNNSNCKVCADLKSRIPLPDGGYFDDVSGELYRFCPKCNCKMSYGTKGHLVRAVNKNSKCKNCKDNRTEPSKFVKLLYLKNNVVFDYIKDAKLYLNCSYDRIQRMIKSGEIVVLDAWNKKTPNVDVKE